MASFNAEQGVVIKADTSATPQQLAEALHVLATSKLFNPAQETKKPNTKGFSMSDFKDAYRRIFEHD